MYERMLDKQIVPTIEEMITYCGESSKQFIKLNSFLADHRGTQQEIRFPYGNKYGWSVTHRKKKKLICDIFAEKDAFTVMLRLTNDQFESLYDELLPYTQEYIRNKYPCGDGGWIHYRVLNEEHLNDIEKLLALKG